MHFFKHNNALGLLLAATVFVSSCVCWLYGITEHRFYDSDE